MRRHPSPRTAGFVSCALALVAGLMFASPGPAGAQSTLVFSTDFESGLPPQFTAPNSALQSVQGWSGLGLPGHTFSGVFLRYTQQSLVDTELNLSGLPSHDHLSLDFLLAVIDSWDGTELFEVTVDGNLVFSNWWQLALGDTTSYIPAPGTLWSMGTNLGYTNGTYYFHDRAYDMSAEPAFHAIPHTASSVHIVWRMGAVSGGAAQQWQGGDDESWAIDGVRVKVSTGVVGVGDAAPIAFGVSTPSPNPLRLEPLRVAFALNSNAPATLALFDISGRSVASRDVGSLGAGAHTLELAPGRSLAPGIYLIRLVQGARADVKRMVVLR